jgi:tetratricopeptide (TPR) repeat protein
MSFSRGSVLIDLGRHASAEQEYRAVLAAEPNNAWAHELLAFCLSNQERYAEAIVEAKTAIALKPELAGGYCALATVYMACGRLDEGLTAINRSISLEPLEATSFGILAVLRLKQKDWIATLEAADSGLAIDPNNISCTNARGVALTHLGRSGDAVASNINALKRNPANGLIHANLGWALLSSGKRTAAIQHFRESLRLNPNSRWAKLGLINSLDLRTLIDSQIVRAMRRYFFQATLRLRAMAGSMTKRVAVIFQKYNP